MGERELGPTDRVNVTVGQRQVNINRFVRVRELMWAAGLDPNKRMLIRVAADNAELVNNNLHISLDEGEEFRVQ